MIIERFFLTLPILGSATAATTAQDRAAGETSFKKCADNSPTKGALSPLDRLRAEGRPGGGQQLSGDPAAGAAAAGQ